MSLLVCPECGGKVSSIAASCPHCGYPAAKLVNSQNEKTPKELKCPVCQRAFRLGEKVCSVCKCALPASLDEYKNYNCRINGHLYDLRSVEEAIKTNNISNAKLRASQIITNLPLTAIAKLVEVIQKEGEIPLEFDPVKYGIEINLPKCPTCGSTNLDKITAFDRGVAGGLFGFASKTARSQFRCKKCGYMF